MKRVALINDFSGYGKCSLNAQIPIIAAFGDAPYSCLTSYLSNNTSYEKYYQLDMTDSVKEVFNTWKENRFGFDAIITGYTKNADNIIDIKNFIIDQKISGHTYVLTDPAFADDGMLYKGMTEKHIDNYKMLIELSDIITPNLTEACLIAGVDYEELRVKFGLLNFESGNDEAMKSVTKVILDSIQPMLKKITINKKQITIITGIELFNAVATVMDIVDADKDFKETTCNFTQRTESRPGTGDAFDAYFMETVLSGYAIVDCLNISANFIQNTLQYTIKNRYKKEEGLIFEPLLVTSINYLKEHTNNESKK